MAYNNSFAYAYTWDNDLKSYEIQTDKEDNDVFSLAYVASIDIYSWDKQWGESPFSYI